MVLPQSGVPADPERAVRAPRSRPSLAVTAEAPAAVWTKVSSGPSQGRRWWLGLVVLVLVAGGAVGWATSAVFKGAPDVDIAEEHTFATVVSGEVGESIVLNVRAQWTRTPVGVNRAAGVVTEIYRQPGEPVEPGAVLYSVDLRPIVAAAGRVPAFRSLQLGVRGADVAQLQALLRDLERSRVRSTASSGRPRSPLSAPGSGISVLPATAWSAPVTSSSFRPCRLGSPWTFRSCDWAPPSSAVRPWCSGCLRSRPSPCRLPSRRQRGCRRERRC